MPRQPVTPPFVTVRQLRETAGLTLAEACDRLEIVTGIRISTGFLASVERGTRGPSPEVLDGLARMYMVPIRTAHSPRRADEGRPAAS